MHSEIGIEVDAPAGLVFALARDCERWSTLLPHYVRSRLADNDGSGRPIIDFVARRPLVPVLGIGLPVVWRSRTWDEPETLRLRFEHIAGATRGMDVTWRIEPRDGGCDITIGHEFSPALPGFAWVVDRFFTRAIARRTLATFKALAEAIASIEASEPAPATKAMS